MADRFSSNSHHQAGDTPPHHAARQTPGPDSGPIRPHPTRPRLDSRPSDGGGRAPAWALLPPVRRVEEGEGGAVPEGAEGQRDGEDGHCGGRVGEPVDTVGGAGSYEVRAGGGDPTGHKAAYGTPAPRGGRRCTAGRTRTAGRCPKHCPSPHTWWRAGTKVTGLPACPEIAHHLHSM